ncbi:MAG: hypothetical protein DRO11_02810 [Methanobacteriota archaeon]|nr:MAG: hypothetical protein DRO11_02810 [Euryarchaeota archaeon]
MPDWVAHLLLGGCIARFSNVRRGYTLLLLGAVLPDFSKLSLVFRFFFDGETLLTVMNLFCVIHTFFGVVLLSLLIAPLFAAPKRFSLTMLLVGGFSHLLLDSLLNPFGGDYWFLWPLAKPYLRTGFFWADSPLPALIIGFFAFFVCLGPGLWRRVTGWGKGRF